MKLYLNNIRISKRMGLFYLEKNVLNSFEVI